MQREFLAFVTQAIDLRHRLPVLRRRRFFQGRQIRSPPSDIVWFNESGNAMQMRTGGLRRVACWESNSIGKMLGEVDDRGNPIRGTSVRDSVQRLAPIGRIHVAQVSASRVLAPFLDSYSPNSMEKKLRGGQIIDLIGHSIIALELHRVCGRSSAANSRRRSD